MINTTSESAAQALKHHHMPSPAAPDALTVTDGAVTVGFITERGAKHFAFDATGRLIGEYKTRVEAIRAISNLIKETNCILKRARCDAMTGARRLRVPPQQARREPAAWPPLARQKKKLESLVQPLRSGSFRRRVDEKAGAIAPALG